MNRETAIQILHNALQPDGNVRADAEKTIKSLIQSNFQDFLSVFVQVMLDPSVPTASRHICSIIIKNSLHSKSQRIQKGYESNWMNCSPQFRAEFIKLLESNLNLKEKLVLFNLTKVLGSVIRIELVHGTGHDFFSDMLSLAQAREYAVGALEAVSYACDQLYEETMYTFSENEKRLVYSIGVCNLQTSRGEPHDRQLRISTLKCILSSLELYEDILVSEGARTEFLYKVTNYAGGDQEVFELSLEVLNRFVDVCHHFPDSELSVLCQFYNSLFASHSDVPLQLFEFWSLLIDLERYDCIRSSMPVLVPNLLSCVKKEDASDTEWSSHKAACSLLTALNESMRALLITEHFCQSFITGCIQSPDLERHAVAETIVGCICGPGADDFIYSVLPTILMDLENPTCVNESLFALAKICEKDIACAASFLPAVVEKCGSIIGSKSEASTNAVWVYHAILVATKEEVVKEVESVILYHYANILSVLICKLDQSQPDEYSLRNALNTTLSELITSCPSTHRHLLDQLESYLYGKVFATVEMVKGSSQEQALQMDDVLCSFIILLEANLSMKKVFDVSRLCNAFVECLLLPEMLVRGEVYIAMSKLLPHFSIHLKKFITFILRDISSKDVFVIKASINLLSDCAVFLESNFMEFTDTVIPALVNAISSQDIPLELKPDVITSLGDIALAIGRSFEPYLTLAVLLFSQINTLDRTGDEDYVDSLRRSVLKLFSCILVAVGDTMELRKSINDIVQNARAAIEEDKERVYVKESLDILSDIQSVAGPQRVSDPWVGEYLKSVIRSSEGEDALKARKLYEALY